jgi:hypothetical protein
MMLRRAELWILGLFLAGAAGTSCAPMSHAPTLTLEQHTLRIPLTVGPDGSVSFAERPPLTGHIDLAPILAAEGRGDRPPSGSSVQVMMYYGRFYVVGEGFHSVWELTPRPGTSTAAYRSIRLAPERGGKALNGVRLSRYGSSRASCLRIDWKDSGPVFITSKGEVSDACP